MSFSSVFLFWCPPLMGVVFAFLDFYVGGMLRTMVITAVAPAEMDKDIFEAELNGVEYE